MQRKSAATLCLRRANPIGVQLKRATQPLFEAAGYHSAASSRKTVTSST